jgi:hypothetical protein
MAKKKATEDMFNELHNIVTQELLNRIKSGEATTADLKAACDWLSKNSINGVAMEGSPLDQLASILELNTIKHIVARTKLKTLVEHEHDVQWVTSQLVMK